MNMGDRVRYYRVLSNISSKQLAQIVGITPSQITKIETNVNNPSLDTLTLICEAVGVSLAEFFAENKLENKVPSEIDRLIHVVRKLPLSQISLLTQLAENLYQNSPKERLDTGDEARLYFAQGSDEPPYVFLIDMIFKLKDLTDQLKEIGIFNTSYQAWSYFATYKAYTRDKIKILSSFKHSTDKNALRNVDEFNSKDKKFVDLLLSKLRKTLQTKNDFPPDQLDFLTNLTEGIESGKSNDESFDPGRSSFDVEYKYQHEV